MLSADGAVLVADGFQISQRETETPVRDISVHPGVLNSNVRPCQTMPDQTGLTVMTVDIKSPKFLCYVTYDINTWDGLCKKYV